MVQLKWSWNQLDYDWIKPLVETPGFGGWVYKANWATQWVNPGLISTVLPNMFDSTIMISMRSA